MHVCRQIVAVGQRDIASTTDRIPVAVEVEPLVDLRVAVVVYAVTNLRGTGMHCSVSIVAVGRRRIPVTVFVGDPGDTGTIDTNFTRVLAKHVRTGIRCYAATIDADLTSRTVHAQAQVASVFPAVIVAVHVSVSTSVVHPVETPSVTANRQRSDHRADHHQERETMRAYFQVMRQHMSVKGHVT